MTPPTKHWRLTVTALLFSTALLWAEEKPSPVPDYQAAHSALIALGLPSLSSDTKWVTLPQQERHSNSKLEIETKGTHWLITSADEKRLIALGAVASTQLPASKDSKKSEPKAADLKADIVAVQKSLRKFKSQPSDELRFAFEYYGGTKSLASVLIFAAQVRQAGHPDLANALTYETLNVDATKQEAIIDSAISLIADSLYKQYTDQFAKDHNWTTYHQNLLSLITKFPRGWSNRDAVALCIEPTAQRANAQLPALPAISDPALASLAAALLEPISKAKKADDENTFQGIDLSQYPAQHREQIRAQLIAMMEQGLPLPTPRTQNTFPSLWLLNPVEATPDSSPVDQLLSKGIQALPVLAALAEDPTLTHVLTSTRSESDSYQFSGGSRPSALQLHAALLRPMSRGELATKLLQATLPDSSNNLQAIAPADVAQLALDFWKLHQDKKGWQIAIPFLNGDSSQRYQALKLISESESPEAIALFKQSVLSSSNQSDFELVLGFIRTHADKEQPFIEDYKNALRKLAANPPARNEYYGGDFAQDINAKIKKIEAIHNQQKPEDLVEEILTGKPEDADTAVETLLELLDDKPATDTLLLLLKSALKSTDPTISAALIRGAYNLEFDHESPERPISAEERALWKKLLDDKRALPEDEEDEEDKTYTVAEFAASALCYSYSERDYYAAQQWAPILKKSEDELLQARATALANGQPLPPWPDPKNVPAERLAEIVKSIEPKSPTEILATVEKLTPDETAAWFQWLVKPGDLPHPDSLKQLKFLVSNRSEDYKEHITDDPQIDQLTLPFLITAESLVKWFETLTTDMQKRSRSTIVITPNRTTRINLQVAAAQIDLPSPQKNDAKEEDEEEEYPMEDIFYHFLGSASNALEEDEETDAITVITLTQQSRRNRPLQLTASLKDGKVTKNEDFTTEKISEFLTASAEAGFSEPLVMQVQILSREDLNKFQQYLEEQESEEEDE